MRQTMLGVLCLFAIASGIALAADAPDAPASQRMKQTVGRWTFPVKGEQTEGPYIVYTPPDWDGKTPLPLLVSLHGAGYRGDDITKVFKDEVIKQIREGRVHDAIVAAPQTSTYWTGEQTAAFIDQILESEKGKYDPDRVYLTGESAGGGGAWEGAKLRADKLAALVPIATTIGNADNAEKLINLPTWSFHNIHDPYQKVEKSRTQIAAIKAAGGKYVFATEYTEMPGKQHNGIWPNAHMHSWTTAYNTPALWDWLYRQRRGQPELALDPPPATQPAAEAK